MSLRRENFTETPQRKWERNITWVCDNCGGVLETLTNNFDEAREHLKENDWAYRNELGEWRHYCEDCRRPVAMRSK
jgi:hypothetical protein